MNAFILKYKYQIAGIAAGAILGFMYWNFIGCTGESCKITSVWYNSTGYGALMGFFVGGLFQKKPEKNQNNEA